MFKKSERLNRVAFSKYFKIGRRFQSDNFSLVYSPFPTLGVSVVVGKKVHKLAVDRNTLKRRVYAAARSHLYTKLNSKGIFIIIAKPTAKNLNRSEIAPEVILLLEKISN